MSPALIIETVDIRLSQTEVFLEWLAAHHNDPQSVHRALEAVKHAHHLIDDLT